MEFSNFNNMSLAFTYSTNLPQPYDLELISTEFGHRGAQFWKIYKLTLQN